MTSIKQFILIDDEEAINFYHKMIIEEVVKDPQIDTFTGGQEALDFLRENSPISSNGYSSVILLDINMPGMNGWEFLEAHEKLDQSAQADHLIALVTSSQNPEDQKKASRFKLVKELIVKPLTESTLKRLLDNLE